MRTRIFILEGEEDVDHGLLTDFDIAATEGQEVLFDDDLYVIEEIVYKFSPSGENISVEKQIYLTPSEEEVENEPTIARPIN